MLDSDRVLSVGTASASNPAVFTFKVSGAGKGTLHAGPIAACANNDVKSIGLTGVDGMVGSISGFTKNVSGWSLDVNEKKTGTFKITGSFSKDPVVSFFAIPKNFHTTPPPAAKWTINAKSGTVTVTVAAEGGSIKATLSDNSGQTLKISGSWKCPIY